MSGLIDRFGWADKQFSGAAGNSNKRKRTKKLSEQLVIICVQQMD